MSDTPDDQLENQLRELTTWPDPTPNLWRRALAAAGSVDHEGRSVAQGLLGRAVPRGWAVAAMGVAAVFFLAVVGNFVVTETGTQSRRAAREPPAESVIPESLGDVAGGVDLVFEEDASGRGGFGAGEFGLGAGGARRRGLYLLSVSGQSTPGAFQTPVPGGFVGPEGPAQEPAGRYVIRKATIELVTEDVRAVFLKAALLISEAKGEYVQDSGITGSGEKMQANLTLRVTAERLPEVLNELRQLGDVRSEKTTGEDVTTQVVDLEARLRNEQRVEAELLQLLEKREDSPLKEILELRRTIADVRQAIEQLTAQRERLSRLVSLATVLVIIRPADAPPPEEVEPGLGAYFLDSLGGAWHKGTTFLVNTFAGLVGIIIGGLIWWILLIVVIVLVRNHLHRRTVTQT
ncbi:MAG TPA: DUF4349 domain-containing protein [Phycisphaerae bacterium]|nr:DUF4349 domain-containing protein [Phycisphaerae bacterium]